MSNWEKTFLEEINLFIEDYLDDEFEDEENKKILRDMTEEKKKDVVYKILNDDEINQTINEAIRYYLFH